MTEIPLPPSEGYDEPEKKGGFCGGCNKVLCILVIAIVVVGANVTTRASPTCICGGCFMGITAECVNLLMTKDDIIRCPNCTRILFLGSSQES